MGSDDRRWGFDEDSKWQFDPEVAQRRGGVPVETLAGQDPDCVVTVVVAPDGAVLAVQVAEDWRRLVDPRALHASVLAAMNTATIQALARQVELAAPISTTPHGDGRVTDQTPVSRTDVERLLDAVMADLGEFAGRLSAVVDHPVSVESAGGHVSGTAQRGQVLQMSIDANWAATARSSEIESELLEVLRQLQSRSTPADLASGPQSPAISELNALLADPHSFLRRLGLEDPKGGP